MTIQNEIRETVYNQIAGSKIGTLFTAERKWINRIYFLQKKCPEQVQIVAKNKDGSILAHIPVSFFKLSPPRCLDITDEQRDARKEHCKLMRDNKKAP